MDKGEKMNKFRHLCVLMLLVSTSVYSGGDNTGAKNSISSNHFAGNYAGINIGHADSNSYSKDVNHNDHNHHYSSTGLDSYNITIGKNWIVSNSLLIGAEAALGYMDLKASKGGPCSTGGCTAPEEDGKSSLRGGAHLDFALRAGLVRDDYMTYVKFGVVKTDITHSYTDTQAQGQLILSGTESSSLTGVVYGGGIERMINTTTNFSLSFSKYDFDMASGAATTPITPANGHVLHHHETSIKIISIGLITKF